MVECESYTKADLEYTGEVLIDTWWNVNTTETRRATPGDAVLIDTWWNVNGTGVHGYRSGAFEF